MRYLKWGAVLAACAAALVILRPHPGVAQEDVGMAAPSQTAKVEALVARLDAQEQETEQMTGQLRAAVTQTERLAGLFAEANPEASEEELQAAALAVLQNSDDVFTAELIMSWLWEESHYQFDLVSRADARGVAQIRPRTGRWIAEEMLGVEWDAERLFAPDYAIDLGVAYLRWLYQRYDGDLHKAFTAYNRGIYGVEDYVEEHGTQVSRYSSCIMARVGLDDGYRCQTRTKEQEGE